MTSRQTVVTLLMLVPSLGVAQMGIPALRVQPTVVHVSSQAATTVILTFSGLAIATPTGPSSYLPAEGLWCGRLVSSRCDPATIYGQVMASVAPTIPANGVVTDVMSVPTSVAQRAYAAAQAGQPARFFYVRRFVPARASVVAGRELDQYVVVTCLLGGSGANAPFALTNVRLRLRSEVPVLFVKQGDRVPPLFAEIAYTGSGRLRGRWEIVSPGEDPPRRTDLLTEGSLLPADRGLQRRYLELERFNVLLPPTGQFTLAGPDPRRVPTAVSGSYMILLRIETSDDPFSDTRVSAAAGAGAVTHSGAAAGFPMPTLRYVVGGITTRSAPLAVTVRLRLPFPNAFVPLDSALTLSWAEESGVARYRVEMERMEDGQTVLSAIVAQGAGRYDVPPFVLAQLRNGRVQWRVMALTADGTELGRSEWRVVQRRPAPQGAVPAVVRKESGGHEAR